MASRGCVKPRSRSRALIETLSGVYTKIIHVLKAEAGCLLIFSGRPWILIHYNDARIPFDAALKTFFSPTIEFYQIFQIDLYFGTSLYENHFASCDVNHNERRSKLKLLRSLEHVEWSNFYCNKIKHKCICEISCNTYNYTDKNLTIIINKSEIFRCKH